MTRGKRLSIASIVGIVGWAGMVAGERIVKCRVPESEACVWAKAFFPGLTVPLYFVLIGIPAFGIAYWLTGILGGRASGER